MRPANVEHNGSQRRTERHTDHPRHGHQAHAPPPKQNSSLAFSKRHQNTPKDFQVTTVNPFWLSPSSRPESIMPSTYNFWLVLVSLAVATLASYTALDLAGRISLLTGSRLRHAWLAGGATAMGVGIWAMHFIGMLAFSLPIPLGYDAGITCYSLAIAIVVS
jgi:hypothetical protein